MEIRSARHKGLRRLVEHNDDREIGGDIRARVRRILVALISAPDVSAIQAPPGWRVHQLSGNRNGTWSISVSGNWRITFRLHRGNTIDLDLEDYH